jgi:predicted O-methyltransferase YrrM
LSRSRWRRLAFGLPTILGFKPRGYFIPYRRAGDLPPAAGYGALEPYFAAAADAMRERLRGLDGLPAHPRLARWDQYWFARLDAAIAYGLVRERRPRRIVEVGSGHSTRFLAEAIADGGLSTELIAIDPEPRAEIDGTGAHRIQLPVPACGEQPFARLGADDVLFIDSSHVLMPGSDVDFLVNRILPALPPGTLVHFHDVFLPDAYPPQWEWRGYNEQLAIAALIAGEAWRIVFSSRYAATRLADEVERSTVGRLPLPEGAFESSLWLERTTSR